MTGKQKLCRHCNTRLQHREDSWYCPECEAEERDLSGIFEDDQDEEYVFIECPGATLYAPGTDDVVAGVQWFDLDDANSEFEIVDKPVFAPNHKRRRRIKREAIGKIRRCRACQDYTIRMRRREGPDFYIPSAKHPNRDKLKSVRHVSYEP
ncbi:hypothetical protein GF356_06130 [candidate division GN15 bacterium]|nr:hypothetical protein [candidate division GN15 bacterium]